MSKNVFFIFLVSFVLALVLAGGEYFRQSISGCLFFLFSFLVLNGRNQARSTIAIVRPLNGHPIELSPISSALKRTKEGGRSKGNRIILPSIFSFLPFSMNYPVGTTHVTKSILSSVLAVDLPSPLPLSPLPPFPLPQQPPKPDASPKLPL